MHLVTTYEWQSHKIIWQQQIEGWQPMFEHDCRSRSNDLNLAVASIKYVGGSKRF